MDIGALSGSLALARSGAPNRGGESASAVAAPVSTPSAEPAGLYISPVLRYDQGARLAVLYFRDFDTGETRDQIPAERVVEQYRRTGGGRPEERGATPDSASSGVEVSSGVAAAAYGAPSGSGESFSAAAAGGGAYAGGVSGDTFGGGGTSGGGASGGGGDAVASAGGGGSGATTTGSRLSLSV